VTLALALVLIFAAAQVDAQDALAQLRAKVKHIVVVYQENWSFDALYGHFPGANGIANASPASLRQVDKSGAPLPVNGKDVDPNFAAIAPTLPLKPYDLARLISPGTQTGDIVHRFYTQQLQIDGG
jgi:phospholipase C